MSSSSPAKGQTGNASSWSTAGGRSYPAPPWPATAAALILHPTPTGRGAPPPPRPAHNQDPATGGGAGGV